VSALGEAWRAARADLRRMPIVQLVLRAVLLASGALALLVAPGGRLVVPGVLAIAAAAALVAGVIQPGGAGPTVVLGVAAFDWALRYGSDPAPAGATLLLAVTLYLHHTTAALAAAVPPTARIEQEVVLRWIGHTVGVLALAGGVALAVSAAGRPAASVPLELAGILAVVLLAAVPALLGRGGARHR
jgi:hypothetical protein